MIQFYKVFLFVFLIIISINPIISKDYYTNVFLLEPHLENRIGTFFLYKENFKSDISKKDQTLTIYGEYKFFNFYSIYLGIPYTYRWTENSKTRNYLDFVRIVNKFQFLWRSVRFYTGLLIDLPRNHEMAGDLPKNVGFLEPYLGVGMNLLSFNWKFSIHWNTQTNTKFKEEKDQEFERKWLYNFSFGYLFFKNLFLGLEIQYQHIYDPKLVENRFFIYGLAISYHLKSLQISFIYLFYPKEYFYDKEVRLSIQKIIDL